MLLGRFQMDVSAALAEWYNLIDCITPTSKAEKLRMRLIRHSIFDPDRLVEQIDEITDFFETEKHMFFTPPSGSRCKHVFVSALSPPSRPTQKTHTSRTIFSGHATVQKVRKYWMGRQTHARSRSRTPLRPQEPPGTSHLRGRRLQRRREYRSIWITNFPALTTSPNWL